MGKKSKCDKKSCPVPVKKTVTQATPKVQIIDEEPDEPDKFEAEEGEEDAKIKDSTTDAKDQAVKDEKEENPDDAGGDQPIEDEKPKVPIAAREKKVKQESGRDKDRAYNLARERISNWARLVGGLSRNVARRTDEEVRSCAVTLQGIAQDLQGVLDTLDEIGADRFRPVTKERKEKTALKVGDVCCLKEKARGNYEIAPEEIKIARIQGLFAYDAAGDAFLLKHLKLLDSGAESGS